MAFARHAVQALCQILRHLSVLLMGFQVRREYLETYITAMDFSFEAQDRRRSGSIRHKDR